MGESMSFIVGYPSIAIFFLIGRLRGGCLGERPQGSDIIFSLSHQGWVLSI